MIRMKCKIGGNRIISVDVCGITQIKNGDVFEIKNEDLIKPEIQFLIAKNIVTIEGENEHPYIHEEKNNTKPNSVLFQCNISKGRKLALDSIKGTVMGGGKIEIKSIDMNNKDIVHAINNNWISPVEPTETIISNKVEVKKVEETKKVIIKNDAIDSSPQENSNLEDISISDMTIKETKEEAPMFRVNENTEKSLQKLGDDIYEANSAAAVEKVEEAVQPEASPEQAEETVKAEEKTEEEPISISDIAEEKTAPKKKKITRKGSKKSDEEDK